MVAVGAGRGLRHRHRPGGGLPGRLASTRSIMRIYDALLSFPAILLGIGVVSVLGTGR